MERNVKEVVIELSFKREVGLRDLGGQLYLSLYLTSYGRVFLTVDGNGTSAVFQVVGPK